MKTLKQVCIPRDSVFDRSRRDTVLDLSDLAQRKIDGREFFEENYVTEGMRTLLAEAFRRLEGKSSQGVFKLTQAMGGGKTHNLIALGLLAGNPELRARWLAGIYKAQVGRVRVVAFSGRETDAPLGIWGEIASQIGKREIFNEYYSPLRSPGQTAWINLLKGEPTLILLDELPPYLDAARAVTIGNSDLARVTGTVLANLFVALGKQELGNVCVVLSDLRTTYAQGSEMLAETLRNLDDETHRVALSLEPVRMNTDEFYNILRTRLFSKLPTEQEVVEVAQAYAKAVRDARQMDITNQSPEQFAQQVQESYPFHPAIRDLYARFRENPGFQQTRALLRLMRIIVSRLWKTGEADRKHLISAHDLDLNDQETASEVSLVNPTLENAVAHDIAAQGKAVAEVMDTNLGGTDTQDACRLLLVASLANVPSAVLGLSIPEVVAALCAPGRDVTRLKREVLEKLSTAAWYLHSTRDGKLYFRNVQNLVAKLESTAKSYLREQSVKELRTRLAELFKAERGWCYQQVLPLPALDEIELTQDKVTLVICEPYTTGLHPDLRAFYEQATFKNRVALLTGTRNTFDSLLESAKRVKAIQYILDELAAEKVPENDPQFKQATDLSDKIQLQFLSAVKETFTILHHPTGQGLLPADFLMTFEENRYEGEGQILALLKDKHKFTDEITGEPFRKKCEARLFTTQVMLWSEIKKRAAMNPQWQWHRKDALDALKEECVHKGLWRENDGFVDKGPFPQPAASVIIQERSRDGETGEVELRLLPVNADTIYVEVGGEATTASRKIEGNTHRTNELRLSFLAVDSTGVHETGPAVPWTNRITLKYRSFTNHGRRMIELRSAPRAEIRYTTDGSDPKLSGGTYDSPFEVPRRSRVVLADARRDGVHSELLQIPVDWGEGYDIKVDPTRPVIWKRRQESRLTLESYGFLELLQEHEARSSGVTIGVTGDRWAELTLHERMELTPGQMREAVECLRKLLPDGQVGIEVTALHFDTGQQLLDWAHKVKIELQPGEVNQ